MRVVTYNLDHYNPLGFGERSYQYPDTGIDNRFDLIEEIVRQLDPDILLAQEIFGRTTNEVISTVQYLAWATGLKCNFGGYITAAKSRYHHLATAILWHPRIRVTDWRTIDNFWHPLSLLTVEINGTSVYHLCHHSQPLGRCKEAGDRRGEEMLYLAEFARHYPHLLIGGDWNSLGAARLNGSYYDPEFDIASLEAARLTAEELAFATSRVPAEILYAAGLIDVIAALSGPRMCTKGHRFSRLGPQRPDRFYATKMIFAALSSAVTITTQLTLLASDHLPVVAAYSA